MRTNLVKQALKQGKLQLGTGFGQFRSPEIPKMLAAAGFQWAFLDTEHGGFDLETVQDICRGSGMAGVCSIVGGGGVPKFLGGGGVRFGAARGVFSRGGEPGPLGGGGGR